MKSLANEARIIRHEMKRVPREVKNDLHSHRVWSLRPEARLAHVAYAYVRGKPYREVEATCKEKLQPTDIKAKLRRWGLWVDEHRIEKWLN